MQPLLVQCTPLTRGLQPVAPTRLEPGCIGIKIRVLSHLITHVLIQGMGDSLCVCGWIGRQIVEVFWYILPFICRKPKSSRHLAGWEPTPSGFLASKPGHFFSKMPAVSAKMHPLWTIWAKRLGFKGSVPSMGRTTNRYALRPSRVTCYWTLCYLLQGFLYVLRKGLW